MKINKNLLKSAGFLLGLFVLLLIMSAVFHRGRFADVYDRESVERKINEVHGEKDNSLEVLFCGDSECYSSFCPPLLFAEYGHTSYVCGTSAQRLCDTYAILEEVFKSQSPQVVVIETNCLYRGTSVDGDYKDGVLNFLTNKLPIFAYHSDWKNFVGSVVGTGTGKKGSNDLKGFIVRNSVNPYKGGCYMVESEDEEQFSDDTYKYLDKILKLCNENNTKLLLVSSPSPRNWTYARHNSVKNWAEQSQVGYLDLNLQNNLNIDWDTDTKDGGDHVNFAGAKKVTRFIGEYLSDVCGLPDLREINGYEEWKESCKAIYDLEK
ncbi:MAG: hypothetical protein K2G45_08710 [Lachnospiraceae bacterium]|nr:hypothetical protein [Lachnospiraceae bacterium]